MESDKLTEALERFVNADDWDEDRTIVEQNPALLTDQAQQLLAENISDYRLADRNDIADYLEEHRQLLLRSREIGIAQAFEEAEAKSRASMEARKKQLEALRPASPGPLEESVWQLLDAQTPEEVDRTLSQHPELTKGEEPLRYLDALTDQAQAAGHIEAVRYLREYHELLRTFFELPPLMRALQEFMTVGTWTESRDVLHAHPELMSDEAIQNLDSLIAEAEAAGDHATITVLRNYRDVIQRAREVGPDQAIGEVMQTEQAT